MRDLEAASEEADTSDYGVHQFIAKDEARDPMCSDDSEAYGDLEAASEDADTSDYGIHQFISKA